MNAAADVWTPALHAWLEAAARQAGFARSGIAVVPDVADADAARDAQRFSAWIDAGHAGEMEYLKRRDATGALVRGSVRAAFPWARSVIVCAYDYQAAGPRSVDPVQRGAGWIARYAWSGRALAAGAGASADYHDDLLARLRRIESGLLAQAVCETRCYVDTGPVVERAVAAQAGIGWIGKNTCLINQELGSWLLLGVIVTSLPDEISPIATATSDAQAKAWFALPAADRCGTCTRCIDACPTGALLGSRSPGAPRAMDASRCISYLTIEKKGNIPAELRAPIGRNVFGCDICQEVCPWNAKEAVLLSVPSVARPMHEEGTDIPPVQPRSEWVNPALDWLADMDSGEFRRRFRGSPLERTGRKRLLRNVAIAMGNSGEPRFLPALEEWATSAGDHPNDAAVRDAALWAREQILAHTVRADREHVAAKS